MKTITHFCKLVFLSGSLFLASCSSDDAADVVDTGAPTSGSYITAKVDGSGFSSIIMGVASSASATRMETALGTMITVLGADQSGNSIVVNLMGITAPGTYTMGPDVDSVIAYTPVTGGVSYSTGECAGTMGTIVVTAVDATKIEGTFSFKGKDSDTCATSATKTVTEGAFRGIFQ